MRCPFKGQSYGPVERAPDVIFHCTDPAGLAPPPVVPGQRSKGGNDITSILLFLVLFLLLLLKSTDKTVFTYFFLNETVWEPLSVQAGSAPVWWAVSWGSSSGISPTTTSCCGGSNLRVLNCVFSLLIITYRQVTEEHLLEIPVNEQQKNNDSSDLFHYLLPQITVAFMW